MNTVEQKSPVLRRIPPAAGFPSPAAIFSAWRKFLQTRRTDSRLDDWFRHLFVEALDVQDVLLTDSGTSALRRLFAAGCKKFGRNEVLISAYTCPDIATAALAAGCRVRLLDIERNSLQLKGIAENLSPQTLSVVLSNLYGLAEDIEPIRNSCRTEQVMLVDDACQAVLSKRGTQHVGCSDYTFGILSFGRGKALGAVGGGGIVLPKVVAEWQREIFGLACEVERALDSPTNSLKHGIIAPLAWVLQHPWVYGLPESLAFLHLGETRVHPSTPDSLMTAVQLLAAAAQLDQRASSVLHIQHCVERWQEVLKDLPLELPLLSHRHTETVPVRLAVLFANAACCERVYQALRRAGLGASRSYGQTLDSFSELRDKLLYGEHPGAESVAHCLLTLPVHRWVRPQDQERAAEIIKQELC